MSLADEQYLNIVENILEHGYFNDEICRLQDGGKGVVVDLAATE